MRELERVEGTILYISYQNTDTGFTVLSMSCEGEPLIVVGEMVGVAPGEEIVCYGNYTNHPSYGVQFKADTYEVTLPSEANAIRVFLASGAVKGIGLANARAIVDKFGDETLQVIETDPQKLSTVKGISYKKAVSIQEEFKKLYGIQDCIYQLSKFGINARQAISLYSVYGPSCAEIIYKDPYVLCNPPTSYPFEQADAIANRLLIEYDSDRRVRGGVFYVMNHNMQKGHCCLPLDRVIPTVAQYLSVEPERVANVIEENCDMGKLFVEEIDGRDYLYTAQMYVAEMTSAQKLSNLISEEAEKIPDIDRKIKEIQLMYGIEYAENQVLALKKVSNNKVSIITGGPGTGKTTLVKGIISLFEMQGDVVMLCAPTGRAAKRLSELSGKNAKTIHRLLEVVPGTRNDIKFQRGPENPIPCDVLIIDEFSMVDIVLFSRLITSVKDSARIVFVGDSNQLPAVGPGNILKDLIDSGRIPCVELNEIFRQARQSDIVMNAHAINRGEIPKSSGRTGDYFFIECGDDAPDVIAGLIKQRLPKAYGFNAAEDIQILCPSRKRIGGTQNLNSVLQAVLNPPSEDKPEFVLNGIIYRLGDKVMQIKNNYDLEYVKDSGEVEAGVFNGDIGSIIDVSPRYRERKVRIDDKVYIYETEFLPQLEHAWAVTVHKSQGSEFKAVILCISDTPKELMYRNLLYTAFTRAKELLVVVGKKDILVEMVKNDKKQLRFSGIKHFLEEYTQ